jgi:hypothetical protein
MHMPNILTLEDSAQTSNISELYSEDTDYAFGELQDRPLHSDTFSIPYRSPYMVMYSYLAGCITISSVETASLNGTRIS